MAGDERHIGDCRQVERRGSCGLSEALTIRGLEHLVINPKGATTGEKKPVIEAARSGIAQVEATWVSCEGSRWSRAAETLNVGELVTERVTQGLGDFDPSLVTTREVLRYTYT